MGSVVLPHCMQTSARFWLGVGFAVGEKVDNKEHKQATLRSVKDLKDALVELWAPNHPQEHRLAVAGRRRHQRLRLRRRRLRRRLGDGVGGGSAAAGVTTIGGYTTGTGARQAWQEHSRRRLGAALAVTATTSSATATPSALWWTAWREVMLSPKDRGDGLHWHDDD